VEARAQTARRIGAFYNQQAGATEMLARETERLGSETGRVGGETSELGSLKGSLLSDTGRRIGSSISDAGDAAVKYLDNQQISHGAAAWSTLLQQKTQQWEDMKKGADPNDPTLATKFMSSLEGDLTKFKEDGFYTEGAQKWAEAHTDALRQHMAEKTIVDMSSLAGEAIKVNSQQTVNSLSATVHGDPSSLDFALAGLKSTTEGLISKSPNLNANQAAAVRGELTQRGSEAIVKSAAIGAIEKTGQVPGWATDPKYSPFINGAELKVFEKAAQVQQRSDRLTQRQLEITGRQMADQRAHAATNQTMVDNVAIDPQSGKPIIKPGFYKDALDIVRNNPGAPSAASNVRTMLDWAESQQNKELKVADDPATKQSLTDRLFDPSQPTTVIDLMRARADGKLSDHSFNVMKDLVSEMETSPLKGPVWQDTIAAVKDELILSNVGLPGKDITGAGNYAKWAQTFIPKYMAMQRAGTVPANALDVKDPNSLISQSMAPFKRTVQQRTQDYLSVLNGGAGTAPSAPGQSTRMVGDVPVPKELNGIAALQFNKSKQLWRDQSTGKVYDAKGGEVAQ
jgi:hypothetical protein